MISVMAVIENFSISVMEIEKFSITAITEIIPKVHNGLNFHNGNWEILDYGHYGNHT